jgi:hypothetical protein
LALLLLLAGCAVGSPQMEPVIDLGNRRCDDAPRLDGALPLPLETKPATPGGATGQ